MPWPLKKMGLFEPDLPDGFVYRPEFIGADEERALADAIGRVAFDRFQMRGVVAKRRVKFYGATYGGIPSTELPPFLYQLRAQVAAWVGVPDEAFVMALINEYSTGSTIGWHRDAPQYGVTAGVSLLSECRMKLRPYVSPGDVSPGRRAPRKTTHELTLAPRSAYLLSGVVRDQYEHSVPPTQTLRYSITFRTFR